MLNTHTRPHRSSGPIAASLLALLALGTATGKAEMHRIYLDGDFADWEDLDPVWVDPPGDGGASGIDFERIWAAEDEAFLYLRFEVGSEMLLQENNSLTLYIDGDDSPATGFPVGGIGAELLWTFGSLDGFFFHDSDWVNIEWADIGVLVGPTHSGEDYEIALRRDAEPDGTHPLFPGSTIRILFRDEAGAGDWAPDMGSTIEYVFDQGTLDSLEPMDLVRTAGPARLVTYNVLFDSLFDPGPQDSFRRILQAIEPDVIAFQEIYDHTATQTRQLIESFLGGSWEAERISDKVLLTRSSILGHWSIADGRAGAFLISPQGDFTADMLVINAHLNCCGADAERQQQCDAIMAFVRDAQVPGGDLDLTPENPIVITGDMNFVGLRRQLVTLMTGDIVDNDTYGPDFAPDWDGSDLADLRSRQPTEPMGYTWYKEWSTYWPGRLDFIIYTDSNLATGVQAIMQTQFMPPEYLTEYGLLASDSYNASDHLAYFADFAPRGQDVTEESSEPGNVIRLRVDGTSPSPGRVRLVLELPGGAAHEATVSIHTADGRLIRQLTPGPQLTLTWDGTHCSGQPMPSGAYWARAAWGRQSATTRITLMR